MYALMGRRFSLRLSILPSESLPAVLLFKYLSSLLNFLDAPPPFVLAPFFLPLFFFFLRAVESVDEYEDERDDER